MKARQILILDRVDAAKHIPNNDTIAIRAFNSYQSGKRVYFALKPSDYYKRYLEFDFDDVDLVTGEDPLGLVIFNREIAVELLNGFRGSFRNGMDIMVHCVGGERRSPAMAAALNDVFELGHNDILRKYQNYNRYVYQTILLAASGLRIGSESVRRKTAKMFKC